MTRFKTIVFDAPWPGERGGGGRGTQNHYADAKLDDLPGIITGSPLWRPDDVCIVGAWFTATNAPNVFPLLESIGVRYVSLGVWPKEKMGMGQYWRVASEFVALGTIGDPGDCLRACRAHREAIGQRNNLTNVFPDSLAGKARRHSEKPESFYERCERLFPGPRAELFARAPRVGWSTWGNQLEPETP